MKGIFITIFFIVSHLSFSQNFKEKLEQVVCKCFAEKKEANLSTLESCFTMNLADYESEIEKLIDKNSELSEYEQGRILGRQMFDDMQANLIQSCDSYFEFFNTVRERSITAMSQNYSQSKLDSLNKAISKNKTLDLLWERGNAYFSRNELSKAKMDYKLCLEKDPNHLPSTYFLAWVYEKEKNYTKAIELYQQVFEATQKTEFKLMVEIAKRKLKS